MKDKERKTILELMRERDAWLTNRINNVETDQYVIDRLIKIRNEWRQIMTDHESMMDNVDKYGHGGI
jgi:seryl-tRNA synthetase